MAVPKRRMGHSLAKRQVKPKIIVECLPFVQHNLERTGQPISEHSTRQPLVRVDAKLTRKSSSPRSSGSTRLT